MRDSVRLSYQEERTSANTHRCRFWKGEEAAAKGTGRQGDRAASVRPCEVERISADAGRKEAAVTYRATKE
jgi:hypothetical protein